MVEGDRVPALHHPPALSGFKALAARRTTFCMPGRLHRWKRVDLVIDAYKHVKRDVPLLITGTGEDEAALRKAAAGDRRIRFLGGVERSGACRSLCRCAARAVRSKQEDYGLITIEAFKSGKPVLTCTDSGETLEFVRDGVNGYVVEPDARAIAARRIRRDRSSARGSGNGCGRPAIGVAYRVGADCRGTDRMPRPTPAVHVTTPVLLAHPRRSTVTVLDMQPIDPPVGGGRLRLLGLYHALGADLRATYVGTYDWPGQAVPPASRSAESSRRSTCR